MTHTGESNMLVEQAEWVVELHCSKPRPIKNEAFNPAAC